MRQGKISILMAAVGLPALASAALAAYPTALVYPLDDGTYLWKVTIWNLPPTDNMYVFDFGLQLHVLQESAFAPEGWNASISAPGTSVVWQAYDPQFMIPPGQPGWGFGVLSPTVPESVGFFAYGRDPDSGHGTKWGGYFTPQIVPEPTSTFAIATVLALLVIPRQARRTRP
jgi:hypothetical protein